MNNFLDLKMSLNGQKFHKLCVSSMKIFWLVKIPDTSAGYGRFFDLIAVLGVSTQV